MARLVGLLVGLVVAVRGQEEGTTNLVSLTVPTHQVFSFFLTPHYFNWSREAPGQDNNQVSYTPSSLGQPALPPWLRHRALPQHRGALLYGQPPLPGLTSLQVVMLDRITFHTSVLNINIEVVAGREEGQQVQLKIDNLNIEDIFDRQRMHRLDQLFKNNLWQESHQDLHLTFADSVLELGGRRPLQPQLKDGVLVRLGSRANFSLALQALDRETQPLRRLTSCSYKRSSVERFFRQAGFAVDWCAFRLLQPQEQEQEKEGARGQGKEGGRRREFSFTARGPVGRSWRVESLLTWSLLPTVLFLLFSAALGGLLWADCGQEKQSGGLFLESLFDVFDDCCGSQQSHFLLANNNTVVAPRCPPQLTSSSSTLPSRTSCEAPSRASSVQRQQDTLRSLARRRDVTPRLQGVSHSPTTHEAEAASLVSRSRTASPGPAAVGTGSPPALARQSLDWEMFQSLNRPQPPAYGTLPRTGGS